MRCLVALAVFAFLATILLAMTANATIIAFAVVVGIGIRVASVVVVALLLRAVARHVTAFAAIEAPDR